MIEELAPYDPRENPRWLPTMEESDVAIASEMEILRARERLIVINTALESVRTSGWAHIEYTARQKEANATGRCIRATSLDELRRAQGELSALSWLLELPEAMVREQRQLREFLAVNEKDEEGPGD